jgi:hypothetical protein
MLRSRSGRSALILSSILALAAACGTEDSDDDNDDDGEPDPGDMALAPELGAGDHTAGSVTFTVIATAEDGLQQPRDLAFNPRRPEELWVVSFDDDSVVIVFDAPSEDRTTEKRIDGYALHFMEEVTAIAFGGDETTFGIPGTFGTCGESRNTYNGMGPENDFMGPVLWSSDLSVFAAQNPNGLGSHLDMLHNTPLCMGIAHEAENRYWVFGGLSGAIDRYDFVIDDGIGNDDHGDGLTWRYAPGEVAREPGVPSHLVYDGAAQALYVADTGNARIARLDTSAGTQGASMNGLETPVRMMEGAVLEDLVPSSAHQLTHPSGLAQRDDVLFVSDNAASRLLAYSLDGELLNYLDTGLPGGALAGLELGPDGKLYLVDMASDRVLRIDP